MSGRIHIVARWFSWARAVLVLVLAERAPAVPPLPEPYRIPAVVSERLTVENPAFHMPTDVAVDSLGNVYVADGARDRLVVLGADGKARSATTRPAGQALTRPVGLAVDAKDRLWVADTGGHRVLVLDGVAGRVVETIPLPALDGTHPATPTGVAVTPDLKRTYVADNANHRLLVRDNGSGRITPLGQAGQAVGQFQYPFQVKCGAGGDVYVSEAIGARLQIVTREDRWAGPIGTWGVELGQFYRPKGVAVDGGGRIFVGDSTLNVVQVFDTRGRLVGCLTEGDGRPLRFEHPMGMAFDRDGRLYVVELAANRGGVVCVEGRGRASP
jgi:DNA-binding beta-propeller fold protein YncE